MSTTPSNPAITIDLSRFRLVIACPLILDLTLQFTSPSRRFYLGVIALVVLEMKRLGRVTSIALHSHLDTLALLNDTVGNEAGSSAEGALLTRIYLKWKQALPNLEDAPLFEVVGWKKGRTVGPDTVAGITETAADHWANLFAYTGSHDHVRLKFAIDTLGLTLDAVAVRYQEARDGEAWTRFLADLRSQQATEGPASEPPVVAASPRPRWRARRVVVIVTAVVLLAIGAMMLGRSTFTRPAVASRTKMAFPLPDEPSIAVLPFTNLSQDPQQETLSDAMTEGVITALARVPHLFVIARASTAQYKGKAVSIPDVSEALGVRYVLEGGVQRAGDRVRVSAQLVDALEGRHVWAERYDRELTDLFALQDELILRILMNLQVKLLWGEDDLLNERRVEKYYRGPHGLDCYLKMIEASEHLHRGNIAAANAARRLTEEVIALCPENPMAYSLLGWVYEEDYVFGNTSSPPETLEKAMGLAKKALGIDESVTDAHCLLGDLYTIQGDHAKSIAEMQRAVALSPGDLDALWNSGTSLIDAGRPADALLYLRKAVRLAPLGPPGVHRAYGRALRDTGRYEEAVSAYQQAIRLGPDNLPNRVGLVALYMWMGREQEARAEAAEVLLIDPHFSVEYYAKHVTAPDQAYRDRLADALRRAGLK